MSQSPRQRSQVIYTPASRLRDPAKMLRAMWHDLLASRELAWRLMIRDISSQYRQSFLGLFWAFIPPVATAVGLTLANNAKVINIDTTDLPYPAYVMFSMALWQVFVESLNGPILAVHAAKPMLSKINFPREAIILAKLGEVLFNFGIKLIFILGLFVWFKLSITWTVLLAPVALVHLIAFGTAIGLFLSPIGVLYQDVSRALNLGMGLWLFLTPVIYPVPQEGLFGMVVRFNPVTPLLVTIRELATTGDLSDPLGFWLASGLAWFGLLMAWVIYRLTMPLLIERMSA